MALDESVIKEFVDVVTQTKENAPLIIKGVAKVVTENGNRRVYATLQNGNEIPISSGVDASTGDIVALEISNHSAHILRNLSDPAAGQIAEGVRTSSSNGAFMIVDDSGNPLAKFSSERIELGNVGSFSELLMNRRLSIKNQQEVWSSSYYNESFLVGSEPVNHQTESDENFIGLKMHFQYPDPVIPGDIPTSSDEYASVVSLCSDNVNRLANSITFFTFCRKDENGNLKEDSYSQLTSPRLLVDVPEFSWANQRKPFKKEAITYTEVSDLFIDVPANNRAAKTVSLLSVKPTGYKLFSAELRAPGNNALVLQELATSTENTNVIIAFRNVTGNAVTGAHPQLYVTWVREDFI